MAPFKEERGRVVRRTLFNQSQHVGTGWLNCTVVLEMKFTPDDAPEKGKAVQTVGRRDGRGSDSRQARLWEEDYDYIQDDPVFKESQGRTQASEEAEEEWQEGLSRGSYGSQTPTRIPWESPVPVQTKTSSSRYSEQPETSPLERYQSSSTSPETPSALPMSPSQISSIPDIAYDASLGKSSAHSTQTKSKPTQSWFTVDSLSAEPKITEHPTHSRRSSRSLSRQVRLPIPATPGSGDELGSSAMPTHKQSPNPVTPQQTPDTIRSSTDLMSTPKRRASSVQKRGSSSTPK